MTNSRDQLFERAWQPAQGRANHKKDIRKSKSKPNLLKNQKNHEQTTKKHEKKYEQTRKTTPVKAQANHKHQNKNTSKPLKKHEQTTKKKNFRKERANHKHKHQKKHGPSTRKLGEKTLRKMYLCSFF